MSLDGRKLVYAAEKNSSWLAAIIITIIGLSALAVVLRSGGKLTYPDEREYLMIARNIADSFWFSADGHFSTTSRPPGYPYFLGLFKFLGAPVMTLKILNAFSLSISALLVYRFLSSVSGKVAGLVGCLLILSYPVFLYTASTLYPQTVGSTLLLAFLLMSFSGKSSRVGQVVASLLYGMLILTIPSFAPMSIIILPCIFFCSDKRERVIRSVIFALALLCVISPWTYRNYRVTGSFVPVSTNGGINLLYGNSERTRPDSGVNADISEYRMEARSMSEVERDAYYRSIAIRWISQNKVSALRLYFCKVLNHFNYRNSFYVSSDNSSMNELILLLTYYPILIVCLVRFFLVNRFPLKRWEIVLAVLYISFALVSAVFFTRIRFRLPMDFVLIILAGSFLGGLLDRKLRVN